MPSTGLSVGRTMRVLVVHNRYSSRVPSGENAVVDAEAGWLEGEGIHVSRHEVSNDDFVNAGLWTKVGAGVRACWSSPEANRLREAVERAKPDVVHIHNLFPLLTGSVAWAAVRAEIPVVWTVHNYRTACVAGTHFRDGSTCDRCHRGWRLPGVALGCYSDSRLASAATTVSTSIFRAVAKRRLTTLAVSEHVRRWLLGQGFDPVRTKTKYNGVPGPSTLPADASPSTSRTLLYTGRLAEEKGIELLLDAWQRVLAPDARLTVVGSGPLATEVAAAAREDERIQVVGQIPRHEVSEHLLQARALLVPSVWEEPFPLAALDGLAHGRPIVTTGFGGLGDMVDESCGWVVGAKPDAIAGAVTELLASDRAVAARGSAARARYETRFTPEVTTRALIEVYTEAIGRS